MDDKKSLENLETIFWIGYAAGLESNLDLPEEQRLAKKRAQFISSPPYVFVKASSGITEEDLK